MSNRKTKDIAANDLLSAYANGFFPMAHPEEGGKIYWHRPEMRGIIPLDRYKIPKNLLRAFNKCPYELDMNRDFEGVIRACAARESTWINEKIIRWYLELHRQGMALSVEAWANGQLAGGLYGVMMGKAFFGESMFFRKTNASKFCLIHLINTLNQFGFVLLDTQYLNPHLEQFGAVEIPDEAYMKLLDLALST